MADLLERVGAGGLLGSERPVLVLLSGGRDSVCLLDVAVRLAPDVDALHCNYGLRAEAGADEAHCATLCERLGVTLHVHRPRGPSGNLQAWARDRRYAEAAAARDRRHRGRPHGDRPGGDRPVPARELARAAGPARHGRPRGPAGAAAAARDPRGDRRPLRRARAGVARGRLQRRPRRSPAIAPAQRCSPPFVRSIRRPRPTSCARSTCCATRPPCSTACSTPRWPRPAIPRPSPRCGALPPALRRLALQRLADRAASGRAPAVGHRTQEVLALREGGALDLGGGLRAAVRRGALTFGPSVGRAAPRRGAAPS